MINNNFKSWCITTTKRAIWTIAETMLGILTTASVLGDVNWKFLCSASILSGIVSVLKSIVVGTPETKLETENNNLKNHIGFLKNSN
ncbi:MAG: holin [Bacilli bacterium]|nr:holin [Bacilli bacterium]